MSSLGPSFQPARLEVDPSILDSNLLVVEPGEQELFPGEKSLFPELGRGSLVQEAELPSLLPTPQYPSITAKPKPGICIKTRNESGEKFFMNLCKLDEIPAPPPIDDKELERLIAEEDYSNLWRVPMSLGAPREVKDKSGTTCMAADVAVNSEWFATMEASETFTAFVITVGMEGLGDKYPGEVRLDRNSWTRLKNKKMMGEDTVPAHRIQQRHTSAIQTVNEEVTAEKQAKPLIEETKGGKIKHLTEDPKVVNSKVSNKHVINEIEVQKTSTSTIFSKESDKESEPKFKIFQVPASGNPSALKVEVDLPGVRKSKELSLDLGEDRLVLVATKQRYLLDIFLPYVLVPEKCEAKFVNDKQKLFLNIPVTVQLSL